MQIRLECTKYQLCSLIKIYDLKIQEFPLPHIERYIQAKLIFLRRKIKLFLLHAPLTAISSRKILQLNKNHLIIAKLDGRK